MTKTEREAMLKFEEIVSRAIPNIMNELIVLKAKVAILEDKLKSKK